MTTFTVRHFEYLLCARNCVGTIDSHKQARVVPARERNVIQQTVAQTTL